MVNIHTDIETLKQDGTGAEAEIEDHSHVPAGTLLRLLRGIVREGWK